MNDWFGRVLGTPDIGAQDRYIDDWLKGIERAVTSATGIAVSVDDALTVPGISACVQVLSEDLSKVPLELKKREGNGLVPATDHRLYKLLKFGPSPWMASYRWRKSMAHSALARGNHFSRVWRNGVGEIEKITPIQSGSTRIRWAEDGEPFFDVRNKAGQVEENLSWHDIIHLAYRDSDDCATNGGVIGVSPIMQNRESVALMLAAERFAASFFGNGARPSIALEYDKKLPNDDVARRIRAGVERVYSGVNNQFKVMILELGIKLKELSSNPGDSQLIETRKEGAVQACTMFRVPPHKIGILDKATFSNIEQQSIDYVTGPLSTLAKSVESAISIACLTPEEREVYKVEHCLEGLMRGDLLSRYQAYAIGRQWGWLSVNKVLERENENGIGSDGDVYLSPLNMVPADGQGQTGQAGQSATAPQQQDAQGLPGDSSKGDFL